METKFINPEAPTTRIPTQLKWCLETSGATSAMAIPLSVTARKTKGYDNVELVRSCYFTKYSETYDLILVWNDVDGRGKGVLFLGHWNDGC